MKPAIQRWQGEYAVCQLPPGRENPQWARGDLVVVVRTAQEVSVLCEARYVPAGVQTQKPWVVFEVAGPLDFAMVGVVAGISDALARAEISIFVCSTFNTDYILVPGAKAESAHKALVSAGYLVRG